MKKFKFISIAVLAMVLYSCGDKNTIKLSPDSSMAFSPISEFVELNEDTKILLVKDSTDSEVFDVTLNVTLDVKKRSEVISPDVTFVIADKNKMVMDKYSFRLGDWNSEYVLALADSIDKGKGQLSFALSTKDASIGNKLNVEDWETIKSKGKYVIILTSSFSTYDKVIDSQIETLSKDIDKLIENMDTKDVDQFSIYYQSFERLAATTRRLDESKPRMAKSQLTSYDKEIARLVKAAEELK